jgi:hypothetical protein
MAAGVSRGASIAAKASEMRCGKLAYRTAADAWRAVRARQHMAPLTIYRCPACHGWHLKTRIDRIARRRSWGRRRKEEQRYEREP